MIDLLVVFGRFRPLWAVFPPYRPQRGNSTHFENHWFKVFQ